MLSRKQEPLGSTHFDDLSETVHWSRAYAQNRSLPVLLYLVAYGGIFMLMFGLAAGGGMAGKAGHPALAVLASIGFFAVYGLLMTLVFSKRGRRWIEAQLQRPYAKEGSVRIKSNRRAEHPVLGYTVGALFGACITAEVVLGLLDYLPLRLMQPISALYCVPFMVFLWWWQRPASTWIMLLWPAGYAVHALLIVSGLPIPTDGMWAMVHMMGAICVYGIIAAFLSHLYSRYALRRLRRLSQGDVQPERDAW